MLAPTPAPSVSPTTSRLTSVGMITSPNSSSILTPMNPKTSATALSKNRSSVITVLTKAYRLRSDRIANMLLVYTMKGSSVTPNTAGMESTANTTSLSSMTASVSSSGVATRRPAAVVVKKLEPS
eukprot:GHRQ01025832.1.p1 GENE.GHRQ01025832.1~~GHRQ01025832.1.p1  ORF type:complete len:125 (+),score=19.66 GHRQ01025832.1:154-528(+)